MSVPLKARAITAAIIAGLASPSAGQNFALPVSVFDSVTALRTAFETFDQGNFNDISSMISLVSRVDQIISTDPAVLEFRIRDDLDLILDLVALAPLGIPELRLPTVRLLADVVDNTTLCAVMNQLLDMEKLREQVGALPEIAGQRLGPEAVEFFDYRYGLWKVALGVSSYAYADNASLIELTMAANAAVIPPEDDPRSSYFEGTRGVWNDIRIALGAREAFRKTMTLSEAYPNGLVRENCEGLPNIALL